ncbi:MULTISPECIES: hypothetical protein [unclassified Cytobacillus]|uniref:hypothetical protein n=1 Tax=unclassified Cytobacillus TaxID=2675268 RepID=UPI00203D10DD|nr:hypothetical protein [Cytobacillus sp. AMY 15.2]MCM3090716.1 hypothetical protein [Cytobacillus sp. AMY 15.2]
MNRKTKKVLFSVGITILLGGCSGMINSNNNQKNEQAKETQAAPSDHSLIKEALQNVGGHGYMTPYYFTEEAITPVYDLYINHPDENTENLRKVYDEDSFNPEKHQN